MGTKGTKRKEYWVQTPVGTTWDEEIQVRLSVKINRENSNVRRVTEWRVRKRRRRR